MPHHVLIESLEFFRLLICRLYQGVWPQWARLLQLELIIRRVPRRVVQDWRMYPLSLRIVGIFWGCRKEIIVHKGFYKIFQLYLPIFFLWKRRTLREMVALWEVNGQWRFVAQWAISIRLIRSLGQMIVKWQCWRKRRGEGSTGEGRGGGETSTWIYQHFTTLELLRNIHMRRKHFTASKCFCLFNGVLYKWSAFW